MRRHQPKGGIRVVVVAHTQGKLVLFIGLEQRKAAYFAQVHVQAVARAYCGQTGGRRSGQTIVAIVVQHKGVDVVVVGFKVNVHICGGIYQRFFVFLLIGYGISGNFPDFCTVYIENIFPGRFFSGRAHAWGRGCATRAARGGRGPFACLGSIENFHLWGGNFSFLRFFGTARAWGNYRTIFFHDIYT